MCWCAPQPSVGQDTRTWWGRRRQRRGREILFRRTIPPPNLNRGENPHKYSLSLAISLTHTIEFRRRRRVCVHRRETTHRPIAASPNHTDNLLDFTFLLFFLYAASPHSSRLVWYVMHFFTFFATAHFSLLFFCFCLFANFFLLCFSSFSRARVVFRLILSSSSCCCCCCWWCYGLSRTPHRDY